MKFNIKYTPKHLKFCGSIFADTAANKIVKARKLRLAVFILNCVK